MASPSQEVRELLDAMDITGKGHVVYSEFLAAAADARTCLCEEVCWNAFKHFDRNDDGSISRRELEGLLHQQDIREERICLESGVLRQMLIYFHIFSLVWGHFEAVSGPSAAFSASKWTIHCLP